MDGNIPETVSTQAKQMAPITVEKAARAPVWACAPVISHKCRRKLKVK